MSSASRRHGSGQFVRSALVIAASWLSMLVFAATCDALDDLTVLRAAVEERLTGIHTLEVRYRSETEATEHSPEGLITDEIAVVWCWSAGRELLSWQPPVESNAAGLEWFYDGHRTVQFHYARGKPRAISVHPGPAPLSAYHYVDFPCYIGQRLHWTEGSLLEGLRSSSVRLLREQASRPNVAVEFVVPDREGTSVTFHVEFDSTSFAIPRRIEMQTSVGGQSAQQPALIARKIFTLEEIMQVSAEDSGEPMPFPRAVRVDAIWGEQLHALTRITVDELRVNHPIPVSRFRAPEFPFGVPVSEFSATAGQLPRRYLAGGRAALDAVLTEREQRLRAELDRLAAEGIRFDSSPPTRYRWTAWLIGVGIVCLLLSAVVTVRRRCL